MTPKRVDLFDDISLPSSFSISHRNSLQIRDEEEEEDTKIQEKKKNKKASSMKNQIWNEQDELALLKGLVDYRGKTRSETRIDWDAFLCFIGGSIAVKISKEEMLTKLKKLKKRFAVNLERINGGNDPCFTRSTDSQAFGFAMMIWGNNNNNVDDDDDEAGQGENSEETLKEDEDVGKEAAKITNNGFTWKDIQEDDTHPYELHDATENDEVANDETLIESEPEETSTDNMTTVKEIYEVMANTEPLNENEPPEDPGFASELHREEEEEEDEDVVEDELCELRDAFETTVAAGLNDYNKKYMLEKLTSLETRKRKDLSSEWKAIWVEEARLRIKKFRFAVKLAEATL